MNTEQIKQLICTVYKSREWKQKMDRMSEQQIMAIYYRLKRAGRLP